MYANVLVILLLLSNAHASDSTQPSKEQVRMLVTTFAPLFYFHPQEEYFPSSVTWFFDSGAAFQFGKFTFSLGKIGERVGNWEHITLRINNQRGALTAVYLSQHAKGKWLAPNEFEYKGGRLVVYASLHSHAHYNTPTRKIHFNAEYLLDPNEKQMLLDYSGSSNNLEESSLKSSGVGLVDDTAKSDYVFDILVSPSSYELVSDDIGVDYSTPPPWLDYTGRWGPKVSYKLKDPATAGVILAPIPFYLKPVVLGVISTLPADAFGEEGSEGPKMKSSWNGDERV